MHARQHAYTRGIGGIGVAPEKAEAKAAEKAEAKAAAASAGGGGGADAIGRRLAPLDTGPMAPVTGSPLRPRPSGLPGRGVPGPADDVDVAAVEVGAVENRRTRTASLHLRRKNERARRTRRLGASRALAVAQHDYSVGTLDQPPPDRVRLDDPGEDRLRGGAQPPAPRGGDGLASAGFRRRRPRAAQAQRDQDARGVVSAQHTQEVWDTVARESARYAPRRGRAAVDVRAGSRARRAPRRGPHGHGPLLRRVARRAVPDADPAQGRAAGGAGVRGGRAGGGAAMRDGLEEALAKALRENGREEDAAPPGRTKRRDPHPRPREPAGAGAGAGARAAAAAAGPRARPRSVAKARSPPAATTTSRARRAARAPTDPPPAPATRAAPIRKSRSTGSSGALRTTLHRTRSRF